jgi:hypothetical protein
MAKNDADAVKARVNEVQHTPDFSPDQGPVDDAANTPGTADFADVVAAAGFTNGAAKRLTTIPQPGSPNSYSKIRERMSDRITHTSSLGSKGFDDPPGVGTHDASQYDGPELGRDPYPSVPLTFPNQINVDTRGGGTLPEGNKVK